jgi:F-type H+-transporting ATPase subunit a
VIFGLEFPEFKTIVEWPSAFGEGTWYGFNKIALINVIAVVATALLFFMARKGELVPRGAQNLAESAVGFLKDGIIMQTIGPDGMRYLPYLASLFFFILIGNLFEIIPFFHMPANARMANPALLAMITWVFFIAVGFKHQGPIKYLKSALFPPGVPAALYLLVTPIEFISTFIVRPFSRGPTLRQHARRPHPAGHLQRALHHSLGARPAARGVARVVLHARRAHRVRADGGIPAGLHLHDPGGRLHRRRHAS